MKPFGCIPALLSALCLVSSADAAQIPRSPKPGFDDFKSLVRQSLQRNAAAQSLTEWKASGMTPHDLLQRAQGPSKALLCEALLTTRLAELTLFENDLEETLDSSSALDCAPTLLARLESHWNQVERELAVRHDGVKSSEETPHPKLSSREAHVDASRGEKLFGRLSEGYLKKPYEIAITIDDGPHPRITRKILDTLASYGVRANFFSMGENAAKYPELVQSEAAEGHIVGSHSLTHKNLKALFEKSPERARAEIVNGHDAVIAQTGIPVPFFRFPYGASNPNLDLFVSQRNMTAFLWNIDSLDWKLHDPSELLAHTLKRLDQTRGGIILMHDIHRQTAIALPLLLNELIKRKDRDPKRAQNGKDQEGELEVRDYETVVFVPH
jgi:peptidoglycan/xylan/chitin deacetylase (PgdA/CDA1 family)